ncbi:MAG: dihydropteroate synthase [Roseinatronobacter sp.]
MIYRLPQILPAATARSGLPALRGSAALRIAGMCEITRDGARRSRPFDAARDGDLVDSPAPLLGLDWTEPRIMGIVNVTPDSFSDGGRLGSVAQAVAQGVALVAQGADILDLGGESTRPGADVVPVAEEIRRTAPVIAALRAEGVRVPISIDTRKAEVARAALAAGADFVNDVSAMTWDRDMAALVAEYAVPICLMHAQGTPQTMQLDPRYADVTLDIYDWLCEALARAQAAGIDRDRIILDPGIGFGKTLEHNLALLQHLAVLHGLGCVMLIGASRKRFIGALSGVDEAGARLSGSVAAALHGAGQGAQILRVHDVAETRQALSVWRALTGLPDRAGK